MTSLVGLAMALLVMTVAMFATLPPAAASVFVVRAFAVPWYGVRDGVADGLVR